MRSTQVERRVGALAALTLLIGLSHLQILNAWSAARTGLKAHWSRADSREAPTALVVVPAQAVEARKAAELERIQASSQVPESGPARDQPPPRSTSNRSISARPLPTEQVAASQEEPEREMQADMDAPAVDQPFQQWRLRSLPSYQVELPMPIRLRYRGEAQGSAENQPVDVPPNGELNWEVDGERYHVSWRAEAAPTNHSSVAQNPRALNLPRSDWRSQGQLTAQGLQPERMVTRRRNRDVSLARFDLSTARARFLRRTHEQPWVAGGQDRLSWLPQLVGVLRANASLRRAGERVSFYVVGSRGDAQIWVFEVLGDVEREGNVALLHVVRHGDRLYDTDLELWLDPAEGFWPERWRIRPRGVVRHTPDWVRVKD